MVDSRAGHLGDRLQQINDQVLSRPRLERIIRDTSKGAEAPFERNMSMICDFIDILLGHVDTVDMSHDVPGRA